MLNLDFERDFCIQNELENVSFRWDAASKKLFRKFYDETVEQEVPSSNRLFNDSLIWGDEISRAEYDRGRGI